MVAKNTAADRFTIVRFWDVQRAANGWWHSFELPDGTRIEGANPLEGQKRRIAQFPIPDDLRGKRVLDIGAWDGWFSFEMERRGAEVMAVDNWDNPRFREMHALLRSRVDYRQMDMYDLTPDRIGRFDIVLFMGVLYHLKHPLLALERVCALTTGIAAVDSFVLREKHQPGEQVEKRPIMEFYETNEFGGQTDNWVGPSLPCLLAFCRTAGFARVELQSVIEHSACVACYRKWEPPRANARSGPQLTRVEHGVNRGINFDSHLDEYVSAWFTCRETALTLSDVKPEVGGYGVRPIYAACVEDSSWQINFKLPPGLAPGWHGVQVRVCDSSASNPLSVAVDVPLPNSPIRITGVCDGATWIPDQIDLRRGHTICLWMEGLPGNADKNNLKVYLDGRRILVTYVEMFKPEPRQVNAQMPADISSGSRPLEVRVGNQLSRVAVQILP